MVLRCCLTKQLFCACKVTLGAAFGDVTGLKLWATSSSPAATTMAVYVSTTPTYTSGLQCIDGLQAPQAGYLVGCPPLNSTQYVTVQGAHSAAASLIVLEMAVYRTAGVGEAH